MRKTGRAQAEVDPFPDDMFMPAPAVRIPAAEAVLERWISRQDSGVPSRMEMIAKLPRTNTNCALAVTSDFCKPKQAVMHPHEKTGYKKYKPQEEMPASTYRGGFKGHQKDYYTSLKLNMAYEPLATRNRLPATSWEPDKHQHGEVMFHTSPCRRYCTKRNVSTFTLVDPERGYNGKNRFRTTSRIVHNKQLFSKGCENNLRADAARAHATIYSTGDQRR